MFWKTLANGCIWLIFYYSNLFVFGDLFTIIKKNHDPLWWRKCSLKLDYVIQWRVFKGHVKIVKIYMVKINVSILRECFFFVNKKYTHKHNAIFNKTVTKLVTISRKNFFPYLNLTSYLKKETLAQVFSCKFCNFFKKNHGNVKYNKIFSSQLSLSIFGYAKRSLSKWIF